MSVISLTRLYELLSSKFDKETARNLTTFIGENIKEELQNKVQIFATKEDLASTKADIIKWMFIFWVGQVVATFGFILLFLKK
jgi:hypothetical protein